MTLGLIAFVVVTILAAIAAPVVVLLLLVAAQRFTLILRFAKRLGGRRYVTAFGLCAVYLPAVLFTPYAIFAFRFASARGWPKPALIETAIASLMAMVGLLVAAACSWMFWRIASADEAERAAARESALEHPVHLWLMARRAAQRRAS